MGHACPDHDEPQLDCARCHTTALIRQAAKEGKLELAETVLAEDVYRKEMARIRAALTRVDEDFGANDFGMRDASLTGKPASG
jgi:hypothetical protein